MTELLARVCDHSNYRKKMSSTMTSANKPYTSTNSAKSAKFVFDLIVFGSCLIIVFSGTNLLNCCTVESAHVSMEFVYRNHKHQDDPRDMFQTGGNHEEGSEMFKVPTESGIFQQFHEYNQMLSDYGDIQFLPENDENATLPNEESFPNASGPNDSHYNIYSEMTFRGQDEVKPDEISIDSIKQISKRKLETKKSNIRHVFKVTSDQIKPELFLFKYGLRKGKRGTHAGSSGSSRESIDDVPIYMSRDPALSEQNSDLKYFPPPFERKSTDKMTDHVNKSSLTGENYLKSPNHSVDYIPIDILTDPALSELNSDLQYYPPPFERKNAEKRKEKGSKLNFVGKNSSKLTSQSADFNPMDILTDSALSELNNDSKHFPPPFERKSSEQINLQNNKSDLGAEMENVPNDEINSTGLPGPFTETMSNAADAGNTFRVNISSDISGDLSSDSDNRVEITVDPDREKPRSSDPHADPPGLHDALYDPDNIPAIQMGQFDTMDVDVPGEPLTPADKANAHTFVLEPIDTTKQLDPTTMSEQFEGDIELIEADKPINRTLAGLLNSRSAMVSSERLWPNGTVPYLISSTYKKDERAVIALAVGNFQRVSCVRFVPRTNERDYIHFLKGDGCSSNVGRIGGSQAVSLGPGCLHVGVVMHELMHALGFWHEQSRSDRDRYITINWDNIQKGKGHNFQKYDFKGLQHVGNQYDLKSLMHYSQYAFAVNRSVPTVEDKTGHHIVGQRIGLSEKDSRRLRQLYPCPNTTSPTIFPNIHQPTVTLPPPVPGLCTDSDYHCSMWADIGECVTNAAWMKLNCRLSCEQCAKKCNDLNDNCAAWRAAGECQSNAPYMHLYCQRSCALCLEDGPSADVCLDQNSNCGKWAQSGHCRTYPGYMLLFCKKACGKC